MAKKTIVDFLYGLSGEDLQLIKDQDWDEVAKRFDDTSKATRVISY